MTDNMSSVLDSLSEGTIGVSEAVWRIRVIGTARRRVVERSEDYDREQDRSGAFRHCNLLAVRTGVDRIRSNFRLPTAL